MPPDLWSLYSLMLKSRLFEEAIAKLWHDGLISGEMHLGTGEEAIIAGVVAHLREGDAMALDHRGTAALLMRGIDPVLILGELLGHPDGLCGGMGGHMHLFSKEHLSASSGIVGAEGPTAAGFALAAQYLRPGAVAVAFFGDGAMNQGMLMESMSLSSVWNLPVLYVCKDDGWAIATQSAKVTGGILNERARGLGIPAVEADGLNVSAMWDDALAGAMTDDPRIVLFGEDVPLLRRDLLVRFGPKRVRGTPISESAFLGAGVAAAMAGLRPVVEMYMVDFLGVCMDALLNHASKVETFSGGKWKAPLVVRAPCGGGYGDGGQHEQSLWGWLAHIPGLTVLVPSTPADAGGLMLAALQHDGPVIFLEHKLLSETWLEFLGSGARRTVKFDVPAEGAKGTVPEKWESLPIGKAVLRRAGADVTIVGVGVGVHRSLEAAQALEPEGISAGVLDLRTVSPLDKTAVCEVVAQTGRLLVVDEDYEGFGLSGELSAVVLEAGLSCKYARVCTQATIPYARHLEDQILPNKNRICSRVKQLMQ